MNKVELNVMELLEYLEEILENAPKVPITGKAMIDTKEFEEVIEQIRNYLPDELKKAKWVWVKRIGFLRMLKRNIKM